MGARDALLWAANGRRGFALRPRATMSSLTAALRSVRADRAELQRLAESQGALRRVATMVARGVSPPEAFRTVGSDTAAALVLRAEKPIRTTSNAVTSEIGAWARSFGITHIVSCPIWVEGLLWGEMAVMFRGVQPPPLDTEERLGDFVELVVCFFVLVL